MNLGRFRLFILALLIGLAETFCTGNANAQPEASVQPPPAAIDEVRVALKSRSAFVVGRVVAENDEGHLLVEESNGTYHQILSSDVVDRSQTGQVFRPMNAEETASHLKQLMGGGEILVTEHFAICSAASSRYTQYCAQLLERVATQFPKVMDRHAVQLDELPAGMAVMIFANSNDLQAFAKKQHPEVDFSDTPGYYSVTHNQIIFSADFDDRSARSMSTVAKRLRRAPRVVETMVHETVHLLQYNSGLMNRMAANPTWLAEGMAVYFEPVDVRTSSIWVRPGKTNKMHLQGLKQVAASEQFRLPLTTLISKDEPFQDAKMALDAYAESWAITWTLIKRHPEAYGRLLNAQKSLKPLVHVTEAERIATVEKAISMTLPELEAEIRQLFRREI